MNNNLSQGKPQSQSKPQPETKIASEPDNKYIIVSLNNFNEKTFEWKYIIDIILIISQYGDYNIDIPEECLKKELQTRYNMYIDFHLLTTNNTSETTNKQITVSNGFLYFKKDNQWFFRINNNL